MQEGFCAYTRHFCA